MALNCGGLPDNLLDLKEQGELFSYRAQIMAREEVIPDDIATAALTIAGIPNWPQWAALLDQAVTAEMPT
mgnify:FL=1